MCGILAALGLKGDPEELRRMMLRQSKLIRHRGPDATAIWQSAQSAADTVSFLCFERLQIIDPSDGGKCATPPAQYGMLPAPCCHPARQRCPKNRSF
jgi:asparagine synthetase B (glutamine-hydrolysing)